MRRTEKEKLNLITTNVMVLADLVEILYKHSGIVKNPKDTTREGLRQNAPLKEMLEYQLRHLRRTRSMINEITDNLEYAKDRDTEPAEAVTIGGMLISKP